MPSSSHSERSSPEGTAPLPPQPSTEGQGRVNSGTCRPLKPAGTIDRWWLEQANPAIGRMVSAEAVAADLGLVMTPDTNPFPTIALWKPAHTFARAWSVLRGRNAARDTQEANQ
jgi:hypothetical protein